MSSQCDGDYASIGAALPPVRRVITRDAIDTYRNASGDHNRIHYDDDFAANTRFGGVIAHGMLTLALASEMLTSSYGADWLESGSLRIRFRGAARPGDRLAASGAVTRSEPAANGTAITCNVWVQNADNGEAIITGTARLVVKSSCPSKPPGNNRHTGE